MNSRVALLGLSMMAVALAGCSGGGDSGPSVSEQCILDDMLWTGSECLSHTEPTVFVTGLEGSLEAYVNHPFTWDLNNGTRDAVHSMDSRIMAVTDTTAPTNMTEPDSFGTEIERQEHKDLPQTFEGEFSWPTAGENVYLWGYMLIDAENVWNQIGQLTIVEVQPNSQVETITLTAAPAPTADKTSVQFAVGGGVNFDNQMPAPTVMSYTISFTCTNGVQALPVTVDAGATSSTTVFTQPTNCDWVGNSAASTTGEDPFSVTGSIIVSAP